MSIDVEHTALKPGRPRKDESAAHTTTATPSKKKAKVEEVTDKRPIPDENIREKMIAELRDLVKSGEFATGEKQAEEFLATYYLPRHHHNFCDSGFL